MRLLKLAVAVLLLCSFAVAFGQNSKWKKLSTPGQQALQNPDYSKARRSDEAVKLEALAKATKPRP
jgi:hypothetical protein